MKIQQQLKQFAASRRASETSEYHSGFALWEDGRIRFKFAAFSAWLNERGEYITAKRLSDELRSIGAQQLGNTDIAGKQTRPWSIAKANLLQQRHWRTRVDRDLRKKRAEDAGHPEWVLFPVSDEHAHMTFQDRFFTGEPCDVGHIAPRHIDNGCEECGSKAGGYVKAMQRLVADRMIETGMFCYLTRRGKIIETRKAHGCTEDVVRKACVKAALWEVKDQRRYCAVPMDGRMVVKAVRK